MRRLWLFFYRFTPAGRYEKRVLTTPGVAEALRAALEEQVAKHNPPFTEPLDD
jgi:hypothetical protein